MIPARGYPLELIPPVPLQRKVNRALFATPARLRDSVRAAGAVLDRVRAEVVVGFGGYVAMPAYVAARRRHIPIVVHEANARAGVANRVAARLTTHVFTASPSVKLAHATPVGIPLRPAIADLDRAALRAEARARFGLDPDAPVLMVTGGSQGAQAINAAIAGAAPALRSAGVQVLHIVGPANVVDVAAGSPPYVVVPFVEEMQYAYAAADFVVCRSGAMTCAELGAVGLPAVFVPLPLRGGEQRLNAEPLAAAGGGGYRRQRPVHVGLGGGEPAADHDRSRTHRADVRGRVTVRRPRRRRRPGAARPRPRGRIAVGSGRDDAADGRPRRRPARRLGGAGAALVRSAATDVVPPLSDLGRVHIMGIAGSGMSALARILLERGLEVSGCEARDSITVAGLRALGATVHIGHSADPPRRRRHVRLHDGDQPEAPRVRRRPGQRDAGAAPGGRARIRAGGQALRGRRRHARQDVDDVVAGRGRAGLRRRPVLRHRRQPVRDGEERAPRQRPFAVVEADESDGSFLLTRPSAAVITNVEADHLENHGDLEGIFHAFELFVDRIDQDGLLLTCADDAGARRMADYARRTGRVVRTYGTGEDADVRVSDIATWADSVEFTVSGPGVGLRRVRVGALIGAHMALNAAAALILAEHLGLDLDVAIRSWAAFGGVHRRFESHGEGGGVRVYDDYAHHPTEIAASLSARQAGARRNRPAHRGVPARHVQPHPDLRAGVRRRAGHRGHRRRHGRLPGSRGADPRCHRRDDQRPDRPAGRPGPLRTAL